MRSRGGTWILSSLSVRSWPAWLSRPFCARLRSPPGQPSPRQQLAACCCERQRPRAAASDSAHALAEPQSGPYRLAAWQRRRPKAATLHLRVDLVLGQRREQLGRLQRAHVALQLRACPCARPPAPASASPPASEGHRAGLGQVCPAQSNTSGSNSPVRDQDTSCCRSTALFSHQGWCCSCKPCGWDAFARAGDHGDGRSAGICRPRTGESCSSAALLGLRLVLCPAQVASCSPRLGGYPALRSRQAAGGPCPCPWARQAP